MSDSRPECMVALGLLPPYTREDVRKAYRDKARDRHPDAGGDAIAFAALREAYERALEYVDHHRNRREWLGREVEGFLRRRALIEAVGEIGGHCDVIEDRGKSDVFGEFAALSQRILGVSFDANANVSSGIAILVDGREILPELRLLGFAGTGIIDRELESLIALPSLLRLDLRHTAITIAGIEAIANLPRLETVNVFGTRIGWFGRMRLRRRLPNVDVIADRGATLNASPRTRFRHTAEFALAGAASES